MPLNLDTSLRDSGQSNAVPGGWLLISLLLSLIAVPLVEGLGFDRVSMRIGFTVSIVVAAVALWRRHVLRLPLLVLAGIAIPVGWTSLFVQSPLLFVSHCVLGSLFFWIAGAVVLYIAVRQRFATHDAILGAICSYLLFGLAWAFTYWAIDCASPGSFSWPEATLEVVSDQEHPGSFSPCVYYSMVTMSTLGYGDVTPVGNLARTLAWIQSVTGQFYVAVVIAWLVSALPKPDNTGS